MWTLRGDTGYDATNSLLATFNKAYPSAPFVMGYWADWAVYTNTTARAISEPVYAIPGSYNVAGTQVENKDFTDKLKGVSAIAYAFLEA